KGWHIFSSRANLAFIDRFVSGTGMVTRDEKNNRLAALMLAGQDGDQTAYRSFLEETSHDVRRFLLRRIPASDVDDVLQEILVSLHKARHTYDGERPILPWIFAIARFRLA